MNLISCETNLPTKSHVSAWIGLSHVLGRVESVFSSNFIVRLTIWDCTCD